MRRVLSACALLLASPQLAAATTGGPGGIPFSISFTATFDGESCESPTGTPSPDADYICTGVGRYETDDGFVDLTNPDGPYEGLFRAVTPGHSARGTIAGTAVETGPGRYEADTTCILFGGIPCPSDYPAGHAFIEIARGWVRVVLGANTETSFFLSGPGGTAQYFEDLFFADYTAAFTLSDVEVDGLPTVPLPAGLPLLALGLGALYGLRRRAPAAS